VNPLVTVEVTYNCHPCADDPDNYEMHIDCADGGCAHRARPNNWLLEHNTMTFTGRLAPGRHNLEVIVGRVEQPLIIRFPPVAGANTGGVKPDSLRLVHSETPSVDVMTFRRCELVNTFRTRPSRYGSYFEFDVVLGSGNSIC
jgi:hypothetical protein